MNSKISTIDHPYLCGICNYIAHDIWDQASHLNIAHKDIEKQFNDAVSMSEQDLYAATDLFKKIIEDDPVTLIHKLNLELLSRIIACKSVYGAENFGSSRNNRLLILSVNRLIDLLKDYPNSIDLHLNIAETYNLLDDNKQSIKYSENAIKLFGSSDRKVLTDSDGGKTIAGLRWNDWNNYYRASLSVNKNALQAKWYAIKLNKLNKSVWKNIFLGIWSYIYISFKEMLTKLVNMNQREPV
ncbi:MAG: hypothetical protein ISR83_07305 [Candidatus Marinimicrobia bacterium]|nr:hypothetical protein [Candidatus Neomarinimicrobiota bacterium]